MTAISHVEELRKRHAELDQQITDEQRAPGSDDIHIVEMKKQKLRLKEEIERLEHA